jgi:hypothetical protein
MARWARRPFQFSDYNLRLVDEFVPAEHEKVLVLDTTTIDKSGKHTYGLGYFYDSSENRSKRCLEACVLGIVDQSEKTAYVIAAELTPPEITKDTEGAETRVDFYAQMLQRNCKALKHSLLLADGFFAKHKFVNAVTEMNLNIITKLRFDSRLRLSYEGERTGQRGRPKQFEEGFLDFRGNAEEALKCFDKDVYDETTTLFSKVVHVVSLQRSMLVVYVQTGNNYHLLACSDLSLSARKVFGLYRSRFQLEFVFRDAKQFTGLEDCQMRDKQGIEFHLNCSFSAVNALRIEDRLQKGSDGLMVYSLRSLKLRKYHEFLVERFCNMLDICPKTIKNHPRYRMMTSLGQIAS